MLKYIFFALLFSVHAHANTERVLLCDGAGRKDNYEFAVPCALVAKTVKLENKSINNGTLYATNGGFYIEAPSGFVLMKHYYNGVLFECSDEKRIGFVPIRWRYDISSLTKSYDEIYKIDREDMQIFFHQHVDDLKDYNITSYAALISHKGMAEDKLYMIDSAGFTLAGLKKRKPAFFGGVIGCMAEIAVGRLLFVLSHAASQGERSGTDAGRSGHNRLSAPQGHFLRGA
ncbi:MAG: hypothetical protein COC05_03900 [Gammaproteobacteria bacterium]|nr:MAG: hypothetical protein COC05_03900 [Gammaproteobacteria bacterium]